MKIMYSVLTSLILATTLLGQTESSPALALSVEIDPHSSGLLVRADVFESIYVGVGGDRSRLVEELFTIVAQPVDQAKTDLQELFTQGTPVAKLYALIGALMIGDAVGTKNYYAELKNLSETEVRGLDGCDGYTLKIGVILLN